NITTENVATQYVMFHNDDNQLASYTVKYYPSKINATDGLIAPIHKFTINRPQYVNKDKVRVEYLTQKSNPNSFLRKNSACNIVFKNTIIQAHNIRFNESLKIYTDASFVLEYINYAERFVRLFDFPFYYRGEVYDPFNGNTLSDQDFILTFEDYVNSFLDSMNRTNNKKVQKFLINKMKQKIK